ncbi:ryncolin-1-like isoform X2 [Anopheles moucheti]|uniref:ryncolin-1-like isoform X2 n=1 Tax=Anopheles moucheti TaxID=186751 RepID=UPI0022F12EFD|nr:ryncolin-1-like isoform X2 [Anopheles moucheti]
MTDIKRSTFSCQRHCYSFESVINMVKINLLCALALCCTIVGSHCKLNDISSTVQGGFAFEMIMTKLKLLEDHCTEKKEETDRVYRMCGEVPSSGIYTVQPEKPFKEAITVFCDQEYESGGWIVIQHRFNGSKNFYRNWKEYKNGFGNLDGEFWLGLDRIYHLTVSGPHELVVLLEDFDGHKTYAKYDQFEIGDESQKYEVTKLGGYSGTAGDSFSGTRGVKFSTFDVDNDTWENHCAVTFTGAWWYTNCHSSNLNGKYLRGETKEYATGMTWHSFRGHHYALKTSKMMIRPTNV